MGVVFTFAYVRAGKFEDECWRRIMADFLGDKGRRKKRRELSEEEKQEINEAFNLFDTDKDMALDYHELKVIALLI